MAKINERYFFFQSEKIMKYVMLSATHLKLIVYYSCSFEKSNKNGQNQMIFVNFQWLNFNVKKKLKSEVP